MVHRVLALSAVALVGLVATGANAKEPGKAPDKPKIICRTVQLTGTRMVRHVCSAEENWELQADRYQRILQNSQTDGYRRDGEFNNDTFQPASAPH